MNRRDFIAAATTAVTGPTLLGMTNKAGTDTPVVGEKDLKFECHHGWGTLPGELEWQTTHGTAVDSQGLIYITHQSTAAKKLDTVVVFDDKGKYVRSFGNQWAGGGHGIDIRKEGSDEFIYLCHMSKDGPVVKTTLKGDIVWSKGRPETDEYKDATKKYNPTNIAFAPNGDFFVSDGYGSGYIQKFDKDGKLLLTFGGAGKETGKFATPHGLWVINAAPKVDVLVVCDRANARLQTFDLDGKFLMASKKDEVFFPANIDMKGRLVLVPDLHTRIGINNLDTNTWVHLGNDDDWRKKVVDSLGKGKGPAVRSQPKAWPAGKFVHPHDACFDAAGNIIVAEWVQGGRVTFLKKV
ncbi:peptidyl-alpha-hydroxyglycine alpha-amidating lyase family protein [soil metagenome]